MWPSRCAISQPARRSRWTARRSSCSTAIPRGHKFALRSVGAGEPVHKYGQVIGRATAQIARGAHVHTHNLATLLAGVDEYRFAPRAPQRDSDECRAAVVHGLSTRGRTRRHAQRDLDPLHRRLRRPHGRAHRATGRRALQGPRRRRVRVPASVRLLAARRRSRAHAQADRGACPPSERRRRADPRARLRVEPARAAAAGNSTVAARAHPHVRRAGCAG